MTALQQQRKSIDSVSRKLWLAIISDMKGFVVSTFVSFFFPMHKQFETELRKDVKFSTLIKLKTFSQLIRERSNKKRYSGQLSKLLRNVFKN